MHLQYFDNEESYLSNDVDLGVYFFGAAVDYVASTWKDLGRPTVVLRLRSNYTDGRLCGLALGTGLDMDGPGSWLGVGDSSICLYPRSISLTCTVF